MRGKRNVAWTFGWLLLAVVEAQVCDQQCRQVQRTALVRLYDALGGPQWQRSAGWTSAQDHCTWFGVACCGAAGAPQQQGGPTAPSCGPAGAVVGLELPLNGLSGSLPADTFADLAPALESINLYGNRIAGALPASLGGLLKLRLLLVNDNDLGGTLPAALGALPSLEQLDFSGNGVSGAAPVSLASSASLHVLRGARNALESFPEGVLALTQLDVLDLSYNRLAGPAPLTGRAAGALLSAPGRLPMTELNLRGNALSGGLPPALARLPVLVLDVGSNRLSGQLPPDLGANGALRELRLDNNSFEGPLPQQLIGWNLRVLDAAANRLSGPLPESLGSPSGRLRVLRLRRNALSGRLPGSLPQQLESLEELDLTDNALEPGDAPPQWLAVDSSGPPRLSADASGSVRLLCAPLTFLRPAGLPGGTVLLDPSYYGYQGCDCEEGFDSVWKQQGGASALTCKQKGQARLLLAAILSPVLAAAALAALALVLSARRRPCGAGGGARTPKAVAAAAKREPPGLASKQVTLVLTDVQGSTELWEWDSGVAAEAFALHDSILRSYMNKFFGYEVSTEGDAFLVAFHEPFDAVAWCLSVQVALHYAPWPERLLLHKNASVETAATLLQKRAARRQRWQEKLAETSHVAACAAATAAAAASGGPAANHQSAGGSQASAMDAPPGFDRGRTTSPTEHAAAVQELEGSKGSLTDSGPLLPNDDNAPQGSAQDCAAAAAAAAAAEAAAAAAATSGGSSRRRSQMQRQPPHHALFRGLRVRMSLATGLADDVRLHTVTQRHEYSGTVLRRVQAVAETPHGGQIIMDPETFQGVHARLPELGGCVLDAMQKVLRTAGVELSQGELMHMAGMHMTAAPEPGPAAAWRPSLDIRSSDVRSSDLGSAPAQPAAAAGAGAARDEESDLGGGGGSWGGGGWIPMRARGGAPGPPGLGGSSSGGGGGAAAQEQAWHAGSGGQGGGGGDTGRDAGGGGGGAGGGSDGGPPSPLRMISRSGMFGSIVQRKAELRARGGSGGGGGFGGGGGGFGGVPEDGPGGGADGGAAAYGGRAPLLGLDLAVEEGSAAAPRGLWGDDDGSGRFGCAAGSTGGSSCSRRRPSLLPDLLWGGASRPRPARAARAAGAAAGRRGAGGYSRRGGSGGGRSRRRSSLSYSVMAIDMGVHELSDLSAPVNLIQVMPCGLEDRARFFPRLDSLRQKTPGFFDAPAAGLAPLGVGHGLASQQPDRGPFPETTVVFCTIDKYGDMLLQNQVVAEEALIMYSDAIRWLLLVAGGYECQEAEGTFMVAFASADAAIEWSLMVQRVLRDMNWPERVLALRSAEVERDVHGRVVFRGPRVKMGIYSGVPTRVVPHTTTGRADYFGQLVNRAARYCHAAARGGQVLVSRDLMVRVLASWLHTPAESITSDCLLEVHAQFDASQLRTWPWAFMRRDSAGVFMQPGDVPSAIPLARQPPSGAGSAGGGSAFSGAGSAGSGGAAGGGAAAAGGRRSAAAAGAVGVQQQGAGGGRQEAQAARAQEAGGAVGRGGGPHTAPQRRMSADSAVQEAAAAAAAGPRGSGERGTAGAEGVSTSDASVLQWRQQALSAAASQDAPGSAPGGGSGGAGAGGEHHQQWGAQGASEPGGAGGRGAAAEQAGHWPARGPVRGAPGGAAAGGGAAEDGGAPELSFSGMVAPQPPGPAWPGQPPPQPQPAVVPRMGPGAGGVAVLPMLPPRARRPSLLMTLREGSEHLDSLMDAEGAAGSSGGTGGGGGTGAEGGGGGGNGALWPSDLPGHPPSEPPGDPSAAGRRAAGAAAAAAAGDDPYGGGGGGRQRRSSARSDGGGAAAARRSALLDDLGLLDPLDYDSYGFDPSAAGGGGGSRRPSGMFLGSGDDERRPSAGPGLVGGGSIGIGGSAAPGAPREGGQRRRSRLLGSYLAGDDDAAAYSQASLALLAAGVSAPSVASGVDTPGPGASQPLAPGALHSSSRLRLVSKRRRQMSYCYDFESSHPGIPAEVADATVPSAFGAPGVTGSAAAAAAGGLVRRSMELELQPAGASVASAADGTGGGAGRSGAQTPQWDAAASALLPAAPVAVGPAAPSSGAAFGFGAAGGGGGGGAGAGAGFLTPAESASAAGRSSRRGSGTASAATTTEEMLHAARLRSLPAVAPLPDPVMLMSLRPPQHRARTPSARTDDSASCFGGAAIENTCASVMQHRWLWVRELLVHDLGQFRFKGVAGTHPIVGVTCEELAGRTFPNTIRKGKGEQVAMGRGLLYVVTIDPVRPLHMPQLQHLQFQLQLQRQRQQQLPRAQRASGCFDNAQPPPLQQNGQEESSQHSQQQQQQRQPLLLLDDCRDNPARPLGPPPAPEAPALEAPALEAPAPAAAAAQAWHGPPGGQGPLSPWEHDPPGGGGGPSRPPPGAPR